MADFSENDNKDVLYEVHSLDTFVKIKQALSIDKMLLSFVKHDKNGKCEKNIDVYMDVDDFTLLFDEVLSSERFWDLVKSEKEKVKLQSKYYPKKLWKSDFGGTDKASATKYNDGKPISRYFTIAPAAKENYDIIFTAFVYAADMNAYNNKRTYQPASGKELFLIRVPMKRKDLQKMRLRWSYLREDYYRSKYSVDAMQNCRHAS